MTIFLIIYLAAFVICSVFSYYICKDPAFSRRMDIETFVGIGIVILLSIIPVINVVLVATLLIAGSINDAFRDLNIHGRTK